MVEVSSPALVSGALASMVEAVAVSPPPSPQAASSTLQASDSDAKGRRRVVGFTRIARSSINEPEGAARCASSEGTDTPATPARREGY